MVRNLAVIPARSGSTRIRDKNIVPFAGRPLMAWAIDAARTSGVFSHVMVSTDSPNYADVARSLGAWVPHLRDKLADGRSSLAEVAGYELLFAERETGEAFENVAIIQPTCPLLTGEDVKGAYEAFAASGSDSLMTCFPFAHCNPWWAFRISRDGHADFINDSPWDSRSQDHPRLYCPTGAMGIARAAVFREDPVGTMKRCVYHPISPESGFDIDEPEDVAFAEMLKREREK